MKKKLLSFLSVALVTTPILAVAACNDTKTEENKPATVEQNKTFKLDYKATYDEAKNDPQNELNLYYSLIENNEFKEWIKNFADKQYKVTLKLSEGSEGRFKDWKTTSTQIFFDKNSKELTFTSNDQSSIDAIKVYYCATQPASVDFKVEIL